MKGEKEIDGGRGVGGDGSLPKRGEEEPGVGC